MYRVYCYLFTVVIGQLVNLLVVHFVLILVYLLIVWCWDFHCDFRLKTMSSLSYLQSYVCYLCLLASDGVTYVLTTSITCGYLIRNRNYLHLSSCFWMLSVFLVFFVFCVCFVLFVFVLCLACPMLPEYLGCAIVFHIVYLLSIDIKLSIHIITRWKQILNYCVFGFSLHLVIITI